ncbi:MAG: hypothetical protein ACPGWR_06340, partial [Ardenticatenaceae bacterium]
SDPFNPFSKSVDSDPFNPFSKSVDSDPFNPFSKSVDSDPFNPWVGDWYGMSFSILSVNRIEVLQLALFGC